MRWLGLALALALCVTPVLGASVERPPTPVRFAAVPDAGASVDGVRERRAGHAAVPVARDVGVRGPVCPLRCPVRPNVQTPESPVIIVSRDPHVAVRLRGGLSGVASWFCGDGSRCSVGHVGGLYAAIRRDLLNHRGERARVCGNGRCVVVTIIDCNCGPNANLIDLYRTAFARLADPSRGRLAITLTWLR